MPGPSVARAAYNADVATERVPSATLAVVGGPGCWVDPVERVQGGCGQVHRVHRQRPRRLVGFVLVALVLGLIAQPAAGVNLAHSVMSSRSRNQRPGGWRSHSTCWPW